VIVLTSRGAEADRVRGLDHGAEDYMVKPFFPRELAARVRRVAERRLSFTPATPSVLSPLQFEGLTIDRASREVIVDGRRVHLTTREFDLLAHLAATPRIVCTRDGLLATVWNSSPEWQTATTVTEHVRRIRQKIERDPAKPRWIITVNGLGYRFAP
jgi:DNA-binding response OmpR family regulator